MLPKFKLDYTNDLTETLGALGMPIPAGLPDFCGDCVLNKVVQKAYLEVDEEGTTAAAATRKSSPPCLFQWWLTALSPWR